MVTHLYNLLIKDAEDTIRHVCKAVLESPETDMDQRKKLAEGVLHIARAFQVVSGPAHAHTQHCNTCLPTYLPMSGSWGSEFSLTNPVADRQSKALLIWLGLQSWPHCTALQPLLFLPTCW